MSKQQKQRTKPAKPSSTESTKSGKTDESNATSQPSETPSKTTQTSDDTLPLAKSQERERVANVNDDGVPTDHGTSNPTGEGAGQPGDAGVGRKPNYDVVESPAPSRGSEKGNIVGDQSKPVDAATGNNTQLWKALPVPNAPEGRILGPDEEDVFDGKPVEGTNMIEVQEDVYREVNIRGSRRKTYVRLHRKGEHVPAQQVQSMQHHDEDTQESTEKDD